MKKYREVKIFPKILSEKPLEKFSAGEKEELTRKGLRWYVYFDFLVPGTDNTFERQKPETFQVNRNFPRFDDRYKEIHAMRDAVEQSLKDGYNPYNDIKKDDNKVSINSALDFALEIKKNEVESENTYKGYKKSVLAFKEWLENKGYSRFTIDKCDKRMVTKFLNYISTKTSNRTRNNYRSDLSAIFTVIHEHEYISENFVIKIRALPTDETRDPNYSSEQVKEIIEELKKENRYESLLIFIYFVSYMFWRPLENCRMLVRDVNIKDRRISIKTKKKGLKTKLIPEILIDDLREYIKGADPDDYLFTPTGPGKWAADLNNRRNNFSKKYLRFKKYQSIPLKYNIYSFRHTFITRVYANLVKHMPKSQAMDELSRITGHESKALGEYIHYIDADIPDDYSEFLKDKQ